MHIPDGYLSPATCAAAYAVALPFWMRGLARVKAQMQGRTVPMLAVVSAFCFTVMMFNLPIPGGTTAHAVGMGVAAILLGPWAGLLSISVALAIQALFFGDGGITSFGANSFNMAIVGCFTAWAVYRLIAGRAAVTAPRRAVAAGIAGYVAINASAFCAALEFGVQPLLFHDAAGTPLYAPYSLSIALPAMMLAHLTLAGAAEAVLSAGIVAWLQRAQPELLVASAQGATVGATRRLWAGVGALMVASPLGLIAGGMAWGEWRPGDLADAATRAGIARASGGVAPPDAVPQGLARLANLWTAPMPDYAPAFLHNPAFGYIASALIGGGLIVLAMAALGALMGRAGRA
ncbi:MAG: cobalt transporter CbiM [Rhodobacteraceae bacterium]|nr:cobalt transporter CbiM [Paracoccaceae bacterium]